MEWYDQFESGEIQNKEAINSLIPHRGEMSFLNRLSYSKESEMMLGEVTFSENPFWVEGHFPLPEKQNSDKFMIGPIFPGVLMIESAAQLGICAWRKKMGLEETSIKTMLLKQVDKVKYFRDVRLGDRLIIKAELERGSLRLMRSKFTGVVYKKGETSPEKCFECVIAGLTV